MCFYYCIGTMVSLDEDVQRLVNSIDEMIGELNTDPNYHPIRRKLMDESLQKEADIQSYELEPDVDIEEEYDVQHLQDAWSHLVENGLDYKSLSRLGNIVEPNLNGKGGYRKTATNFGAPPEHIHQYMKAYSDYLESTDEHPLYRSNEAHLSFVQIHPYRDGNGRSARLIHNFTLKQRGYPPLILGKQERDKYIHLMQKARESRYQDSVYIRTFGKKNEEEQRLHKFFLENLHESVSQMKDNIEEVDL